MTRFREPTSGRMQIDPLKDTAQMLFTSGTTARPKGVILTHGNFLYMGDTVVNNTALRPDDRTIVVLPLFHVNAMCCSWFSTLAAGARSASKSLPGARVSLYQRRLPAADSITPIRCQRSGAA